MTTTLIYIQASAIWYPGYGITIPHPSPPRTSAPARFTLPAHAMDQFPFVSFFFTGDNNRAERPSTSRPSIGTAAAVIFEEDVEARHRFDGERRPDQQGAWRCCAWATERAPPEVIRRVLPQHSNFFLQVLHRRQLHGLEQLSVLGVWRRKSARRRQRCRQGEAPGSAQQGAEVARAAAMLVPQLPWPCDNRLGEELPADCGNNPTTCRSSNSLAACSVRS